MARLSTLAPPGRARDRRRNAVRLVSFGSSRTIQTNDTNDGCGDVSPDFEEMRRRYADLSGRATAVYGLSPLLSRLYGTLLLTPRPLSLDELAGAVGAAKSTVSAALRNLERYRLVRREWARGDRRDYYVAHRLRRGAPGLVSALPAARDPLPRGGQRGGP